jgi:dTDP-4-dehydrorhamnose reductase
MRLLVLGGTGLLGQEVVAEARRRRIPALGLSRRQADVRERGQLERAVASFRPTVLVNCAAFTRVDDCESQRELAFEVNGRAVANVAGVARAAGLPLIQVSTDYVFDGQGTEAYREDHPVAPRSVYGASKRLGEEVALAYDDALVLRVSWLFGAAGPNFVATMIRLMAQGQKALKVVDDQVGGPTYTLYVARALCDLATLGARGLVHYQNREAVSWYGFTREIARQWNPRVEVVPVTTAAFPRPAPRPAYSVLDVSRFEELAGRTVETWSAGLAHYLDSLRSTRREA